MTEYVKRREHHGIELWVSTTWTHWKYIQFREATSGLGIYDQKNNPVTRGLKAFYAAFEASVTEADGKAVAELAATSISDRNYEGVRRRALDVRYKLEKMCHAHGVHQVGAC